MSKIRLLSVSLLLGLGALAVPPSALAADPKKPEAKAAGEGGETAKPKYERICKVDVNYLWRVKPVLLKYGQQISKEYFTTVSEQGWVPEQIQEQLKVRLGSVRAEAMRACRRAHQEEAGCIEQKFAKAARFYPRLDYVRRQMIFEAVRRDCSNYLGDCVATEISEMTCWMNVPPDAIVPNEPRIEVAQPGNTEPPMEVTPVAAPIPVAPGGDSENAVAAPPPGVLDRVPVKKKPKKKKKAEEKAPEKPPEIEEPPPPADNPYNQPFSIQ